MDLYICTHVYTYMCTYVHMCMCTYYMCIHIDLYVHLHLNLYVREYIRICICIHICIYLLIQISTPRQVRGTETCSSPGSRLHRVSPAQNHCLQMPGDTAGGEAELHVCSIMQIQGSHVIVLIG